MQRLNHIFLVIVLFALGCARTQREKEFLNPRTDVPLREAYNVRFVFSEEAVIKATLEAPHAIEREIRSIDDNGKEKVESVQEFDRGVKMTFYDDEGNFKSTLTADSAWFPGDFKRAEFVGKPVTIEDISGRVMTSLKLYWNKDSEEIWAPYHRYPPVRKYKVDRQLLEGNAPDAVKEVFDKNFSEKADTAVVREIRHLADSVMAIPEKTPGDIVLFDYFASVLDTTVLPATINRVHVETENDNIYADSLWAKMDFSAYNFLYPRGSVKMEEGF